ncbi:MAG: CheR family methyltransferase, partial [Mariprofundaceae bacterium]|nr:CheR family methyltransferase [Mariprofundaceae bacterium]
DLSEQAVAYGKSGIYSQMEVKRGLPEKQLARFFSKEGATWQVRQDLKRMMTFQTANLVEDAVVTRARSYGPFDIVFCRNVLIYFSPEERKNVIDRLAKTMKPRAYLLTGAADRVVGHVSKWECTMFQGKRIWQLQ